MKRCFALLLAFLLLPCAALAGETNEALHAEATPEPTMIPAAALETAPPDRTAYPCTAVAAARYYGETVPMYAQPDEESEVLMTYYRGARITVLREALPGYVLAQCGTREASLMGYMKKGDLAFGSGALREIQPEYVMVQLNRETPIYAYCDGQSEIIGTCDTESEYYTIGKNGGMWVQLYCPANQMVGEDDGLWWQIHAGDGASAGFVQLETGLARGYEVSALRWEVEPIPGEITREAAVDLAIWWMMNAQGDIPEELRREEVLRALPFDTAWAYSPPDSGFVNLSVDVTYECDEYSISVGLYPDGEIRYGRYEEAAEGS